MFMMHFVGWSMSHGLIFRRQESTQILNTWEGMVAAISDATGGKRIPYGDLVSAVLIIIGVSNVTCCVVAQAILSLLFSNLPVCLYPMCKKAGLIPDIKTITLFMWQLAYLQ